MDAVPPPQPVPLQACNKENATATETSVSLPVCDDETTLVNAANAPDADDCCLICYPLLRALGLTLTSAWLTSRVEEHCLYILQKEIPRVVETAAAFLSRRVGGHIDDSDPPDLAANADLLAFCAAALETEWSRGMVRAITPDRFLPPNRLQAHQRCFDAACPTHCTRQVWTAAKRGQPMAYRRYRSPPEGSLARSGPRDLRTIMEAFECCRAAAATLRLCTVFGEASGGTRLLVSDAAFVSLAQYRALLRGVDAAERELLQLSPRLPNCGECALSPAVVILDPYGEGVALPQANIIVHSVAPSLDLMRAWHTPFMIHTTETLRAGPTNVTNAITWCFGGVENPRGAFLLAVRRLVAAGATVVEAVQMAHDILLGNYSLLQTQERRSISMRNDYIKPELANGRLYNCATNTVYLRCG